MNAIDRAIWASRIGQLLGQHHAEHLQQTIDLFERGDTIEALKHAIPLGGEVEAALRRLSWRLPGQRSNLTIHAGQARASVTLGLGPTLYAQLQRLYRDAFRRLEAQRAVDEAAFILAELLHANEEAVAFLEKHGRLRLAAEMAEARKLPPGLVVRQWFIAGDRERAVAFAIRHQAFADAVARLERAGSVGEATALRLVWADTLSSAGDYVAAVNAAWSVPEAARLVETWIDLALATNSPSATALLARKLQRRPDLFADIRDAVVDILDADDAENTQRRLLLAQSLVESPAAAGIPTLARAASRALVRDAGLYGREWTPSVLRDLVRIAADGALRADLAPALSKRTEEPLKKWARPFNMTVDEAHIGTGLIYDVALLPSGNLLVARGESGAFLVSRSGKTVAHFDVPAHRLVISDHGDRAIAVAPRDFSRRLSRIDLARRRAEHWCDADIAAFAPHYDGRQWFVASNDLFALDVTKPGFEASWHVPDLTTAAGGVVIARSGTRLHIFVPAPLAQVWTYELPSLTLRQRRDVTRDEAALTLPALSPEGLLLEHAVPAGPVELRPGGGTSAEVLWELDLRRRVSHRLLSGDEKPGPLAIAGEWAAATAYEEDAARIVLLDVSETKVRAVIRLERTTAGVALRFGDKVLTVADPLGRILVLDLQHGWLLRDLRI